MIMMILAVSCEKMIDVDNGYYIHTENGLVKLDDFHGRSIYWAEEVTPEQKKTILAILQNMVSVEGGTFMMGAQNTDNSNHNYDADAAQDESPVHQVTLRDFYIDKYVVTQKEWTILMGTNSKWTSNFGLGDDIPAYYISYNDAIAFINKINSLTGLGFRLPTEAEWEFAARGGNDTHGYKYSGSNELEDVGWYSGNSGNIIHNVGIKQANELGIYDMSGNLWEWCSDYYGDYSENPQSNPIGSYFGTKRVLRGGSFAYTPNHCRNAVRDSSLPQIQSFSNGFRLVISL